MVTEVRRLAPGFTPDEALVQAAGRMRLLGAAQWLTIAGLVVASYVVDSRGHSAASWVLDAAAIAVYLLFRLAKRRSAIPRAGDPPAGADSAQRRWHADGQPDR